MSTVKPSLSVASGIGSKWYPLKGYSKLKVENKDHRDFVKKIAEPFISYKNRLSQQTQINIAGYKTVGSYINSDKASNGNQQYTITKQSIQKYIFTFCFETGCDLPSDDQMKLIYTLLLTHSKASSSVQDSIDEKWDEWQTQNMKTSSVLCKKKNEETIKKSSFYLLIKLCLEIYAKAKQQNIGGILQRLIIGIRKQIEAQDQNKQNCENSKSQQMY